MHNLLVFDIGFNHGNFTSEILVKYPGTKIIGVDGHPMYTDLFRQERFPNTILLHNVVSDINDQEITFYICDSNPGINSINPEWIKAIRHSHFFEKTKREIKVKAITLDSLIERYGSPDIIKLDIEGAEAIALRGLTRKSGIITLEWSEEFFHETLTCVEHLRSLGYTLFASDSHWEGANEIIVEYNENLKYKSWEDLNLVDNIDPNRKARWGMLYAR